MSTSYTWAAMPGAITTPELVGRAEDIALILRQIQNAGSRPQILFLFGDGGIGKTVLLKALLQRLQTEDHSIPYTDLVDLYDIPNHSPEGLVESIVQRCPESRRCFVNYDKQKSKLQRMRLAGGIKETASQLEAVYQAFLEELIEMGTGGRVIIALDTAERLVYLPNSDHGASQAASWTWLIAHIAQLQNVTFLVAGRKESGALVPAVRALETVRVETHTLQPFTEAESLQYFERVIQANRTAHLDPVADQVEKLPIDRRTAAHIVSGGRPILLSMLVDFLASGGLFELPPGMQMKIADLKHLAPGELVEVQRAFESHLLDKAVNDPQLGQTILALGRAPRGLNPRLLAALRGISESTAELELRKARRYTFVKVRDAHPGEEMYFLHDLVYDLLNTHIFSAPNDAPIAEAASQAIAEYYKKQYKDDIAKINDLLAPVEEQGSTNLEPDVIAMATAHRSATLVDWVYYQLRSSAAAGFRLYYRFLRESLESDDLTLFLMLEGEMSAFLSQPEAGAWLEQSSLPRELVTSELRMIPIKQAWIGGQHDQMMVEIRQLLKNEEELLPPVRFSLKVWEALGLNFGARAENLPNPLNLLSEVITALKPAGITQEEASEDTLRWYERTVLAAAYHARAYMHWSAGRLQSAIQDYRRAVPHWRDVNIKILLAKTQNDLGFAMSELGESSIDARMMVENALDLRKEVGALSPVALSLNTLGIIYMREGNFAQAEAYSLHALRLARLLGDQRTIGLALTALSEALRRRTFNDRRMSVKEKIQHLREARDHAKEALEIASKSGETLRDVAALIEWGCACRDWVRLRKIEPDLRDDIEQLMQESREQLEKAATTAGQQYLVRRVDALVNLAWLWFYAQKYTTARETIERIKAEIPTDYFLVPGAGRLRPPADNLLQLWLQLSKVHVLAGHILMEEWKKTPSDDRFIQAVESYAQALEYTNLYSEEFPGVLQAKGQIFDYFHTLRTKEIYLLAQQVEKFETDYSIPNSALRAFLVNRALLAADEETTG